MGWSGGGICTGFSPDYQQSVRSIRQQDSPIGQPRGSQGQNAESKVLSQCIREDSTTPLASTPHWIRPGLQNDNLLTCSGTQRNLLEHLLCVEH